MINGFSGITQVRDEISTDGKIEFIARSKVEKGFYQHPLSSETMIHLTDISECFYKITDASYVVRRGFMNGRSGNRVLFLNDFSPETVDECLNTINNPQSNKEFSEKYLSLTNILKHNIRH